MKDEPLSRDSTRSSPNKGASDSSPMHSKTKSPVMWPFLLVGAIVLVGAAFPNACRPRPSPNAAILALMTSTGGSIAYCLKMYAYQHEGYFPPKGKDANESLRHLFPIKFTESAEGDFYLDRDLVYCQRVPPDHKVEGVEALAPGENHWSYVAGLKDDAPGGTPILADGFTSPGHRYDKRHYLWEEKLAVVGYSDGTSRAERLVVEGETGYVPAPNGKGNLFDPENLPPGAVVLNPALPKP